MLGCCAHKTIVSNTVTLANGLRAILMGGTMKRTLLCLVVACLAPVAARADITYNISFIVGTGSVNGFIQTDGKIGALSGKDITNWNLPLTEGATSFDLTPMNSDVETLNNNFPNLDFTATATTLSYDFSGPGVNFLIFRNPAFGSVNYVCFEDLIRRCTSGLTSSTGDIDVATSSKAPQLLDLTGVQVVATTGVTPTPEPGSLLLLGSGLLSVGPIKRRLARSGSYRREGSLNA